MNEHDTDQRLRSWVRSPADRPAPAELRQQIFDIPTTEPTTHRRRWLWFLPGPKPTAGAEEPEDHPGSPSPTNEPTRGTRTMFSATKLVGIAAAVALFGALMLAVPPNPQQSDLPPSAPVSEPGGIMSFSGDLTMLGQDRAPEIERLDWGNDLAGEQWTMRYTMSDPRLSGVSSLYQNVYEVGGLKTRLMTQEGRRFTEEGSWYETGHAYRDPDTMGIQFQTHLVGEGVYEGLYAINVCEQPMAGVDWACHGIIFSGGWPEAPGEAPTEIPAIHGTP